MANTNVLAGWACPKCGQTEGFRIAGTIWLDVTDDGTVPSDEPGRTDHEWDGDSTTECPGCGYVGRQAEFHEDLELEQTIAALKEAPRNVNSETGRRVRGYL
ncbi:MAG: hypothetical protein OXU74_06650 [Gemmatimonadota bacterium]|nr:hypothetical protein [Gemmatimonadota bacterium]